MDKDTKPDKLVEKALSLIRSAQLSVAEHKVLSFFIEDAVDPKYAAEYLLKRVPDTGNLGGTEHSLRQFKDDWRQLTERREFTYLITASGLLLIDSQLNRMRNLQINYVRIGVRHNAV